MQWYEMTMPLQGLSREFATQVLPGSPQKEAAVMPTIRLTQRAVETLKPPATGRVEYWDSHLPGFGLRVAGSGRKTWVRCTVSTVSSSGRPLGLWR
jgi:hypothetical protein